MSDEFQYREWDESDRAAMTAAQDQTKAEAMAALRSGHSFIVTTAKGSPENPEGADVESFTSFASTDPLVFSTVLQATSEGIAASWFANNGASPRSFAGLMEAFGATAALTLTKFISEKGE